MNDLAIVLIYALYFNKYQCCYQVFSSVGPANSGNHRNIFSSYICKRDDSRLDPIMRYTDTAGCHYRRDMPDILLQAAL